MTDPSHPFSRLLALRDLPGVEGKRLTETATDEERDIIAKEFNLSGLKNFRVEARIEKEGKTGWRAEGRIIATASQPCVVSLEPVIQKIDESFTRSFIPMTKAETEEFYTNINLDPMADDPPEPWKSALISVMSRWRPSPWRSTPIRDHRRPALRLALSRPRGPSR